MRVTTLDPISLEDVTDLENAPFLVEGEGEGAIRIYFRSEENRQEYLDMEMHGADNSPGLKRLYDAAADSPITGSIN
jgi:hypothetical protein